MENSARSLQDVGQFDRIFNRAMFLQAQLENATGKLDKVRAALDTLQTIVGDLTTDGQFSDVAFSIKFSIDTIRTAMDAPTD